MLARRLVGAVAVSACVASLAIPVITSRALAEDRSVVITYTDSRDVTERIDFGTVSLYVGPPNERGRDLAGFAHVENQSFDLEVWDDPPPRLSGVLVLDNHAVRLRAAVPSAKSKPANLMNLRDGSQEGLVWFEGPEFDATALEKVYGWDFRLNLYDSDFAQTGYSFKGLMAIWQQVNAAADFINEFALFLDDTDVKRMHKITIIGDPNAPNPSYSPSNKSITLNSGTFADNSLLLHEYGHAVMHAQFGPYNYLANSTCGDPRLGHHLMSDRLNDEQCAFIEGWADFFAIAIASMNGFEADGTFQYAVPPVFDFTPKFIKNAQGFQTTEPDFGESSYALKPANEGHTVSVLWRLHRYSGVPTAAFFNALKSMGEAKVSPNDLTLANYLPYLARSFKKLKSLTYQETSRGIMQLPPSTVLKAFPRASQIFVTELNN